MPHSVEWQKKHGPAGFIFIGFHSSKGESKGELVAYCKQARINFPVYEGGGISGVQVSGVPHFVLFDHTGQMVYNGRLGEADKEIATAMKNAPDPLVGEGPYKKLAGLTQKIKDRKELGKVLAALKTKHVNSTDADEKAEAEKLVERLTSYGNRMLAKAEAKKSTEPLAAFNLYQQTATLFKGDEIGDNAEKTVKELKEDKAFQSSIKADKELAEIMAEWEKLKPCRSCGMFGKDCEDCRKKNSSFDALKQRIEGLIKRYPDTPAAQKAKDLLKSITVAVTGSNVAGGIIEAQAL